MSALARAIFWLVAFVIGYVYPGYLLVLACYAGYRKALHRW